MLDNLLSLDIMAVKVGEKMYLTVKTAEIFAERRIRAAYDSAVQDSKSDADIALFEEVRSRTRKSFDKSAADIGRAKSQIHQNNSDTKRQVL